MSFSFEKVFASKSVAIAVFKAADNPVNTAPQGATYVQLTSPHNAHVVPKMIRDFIIFGLEHLDDKQYSKHLIRVKAVGHLCDSSGSYAITNADVVVAPMEIANE